MRTLPPELVAAATHDSTQPYVQIELQDRYLGVPNLRWTRWYSGTEPEGPCLAAVPADGSLVRARIDPAAARIYLSRVAGPSSGSTYSSWTNHDAASATPRLGLSAHTTRALVAWYDGANIRFSDSSDSGATWSVPATASLVGAGVTAVACAIRQSSGTAAIFYALGGTVYAMTRTGSGAWSVASAWTVTSFASVNSLAAMATADYDLIVSGTLTGVLGSHSVASAVRFGAGVNVSAGTWSALEEVALASAGTDVTLRALSVGVAHTPRILLQEEFTSGYGPVQMSSGLADSMFDPPQPADPRALDYAQQHGLGCAGLDSAAYLVSARGVWRATIDTAVYDLTGDVHDLEFTQETSRIGRAHLVLRNDDGRYAEDGPIPLHPQTQLTISPGYVTTSGPLASLGPRYYVERVTRRRAEGRHVAIVEAVDAFGALAAWKAPSQFTWLPGTTTASLIATSIARRAGVDAIANWSTEASVNYLPALTLPAGVDGLAALRRLLADVPDDLRADLDRVVAFEPLPSDTSGYSYGLDHPIQAMELIRERARLGWARVVGVGVRSELTDASQLLLGGPAVIEVDRNLAVQARADARAATLFRQAAAEAARGSFTARPFVGLEVGDVIDITDATLGITAREFRVRALRLRYSTGRTPSFEVRVDLTEK